MNFLDHLENYSNLPLVDKEFLLNSGVYSMKGNLDNFIKSSKLYSDKIKNFKIINENDFRPEMDRIKLIKDLTKFIDLEIKKIRSGYKII